MNLHSKKLIILIFLFTIFLSACSSGSVARPDTAVSTTTGSEIVLELPRTEAEKLLPPPVDPSYSPTRDGTYWRNIYETDSRDRISVSYDSQEDKILMFEVQSSGDVAGSIWALPGGITIGTSRDKIVTQYGMPTHDSGTQLAYYYDENNHLLTDTETTSDTLKKAAWLELDDTGLCAFTVMTVNEKTIVPSDVDS